MARLVALGDSLTQGFRSLAITDTTLSAPSLIAEAMGLSPHDFRSPDFRGQGGLPLNVERVVRELETRCGGSIGFLEWAQASLFLAELVDDVEDFWERGDGSKPVEDELYHNLAVWGFEVGDAYNLTAELAKREMGSPKDNLLRGPSHSRLRTAYRVLNPSGSPARERDTQVAIAKRIQERDGGIDHLIVAFGANNCLGTVVDLEVRETGPNPPGPCSDRTLWTPDAFHQEYRGLERRVAEIQAEQVYVATVPHITIPPITRGIMEDRGELPEGRKYFDYYTRFLVKDGDFDPDFHSSLTGAEAEKIDRYIDAYNQIIRETAERNGWHVVDLCSALDRLAVRRNHGRPTFPLPEPIADLSILFFEIEPDGGIRQGGLISLDGIHPTVTGYGIIAQEFINVMREFEPGLSDIDFQELRKRDKLVSSPPKTLDDAYGLLRLLDSKLNVLGLLRKVRGSLGPT